MDSKPIITWYGDEKLFSSLHPLLTSGLPRESVEWRRSYGRVPRTIQVEAEFVPFSADKLVRDARTLLGYPFFHIYWTDCDLDAYKGTVKDDITSWLGTLKKHNVSDWLIVVVVHDENKVKTKILRTSVVDKVRSDFCNKTPDRGIVLTEPLRTDSKSSESWSTVLSRMRQLLLQGYNRGLNRFEDGMRAERERRTQSGWSFCHYFLLQEELAFVFDMLGLYDDALVQYDELDALFTQFVLNHNAGDTPDWLLSFSATCTRWEGLRLSTTINEGLRGFIQQNQATLLDLRGYLFSRQCALLLLMHRPWEVAQRAISFLNNCIQELKILEVDMPPGSVACWSFASCLEVMDTCERYSGSGQVETYSLYTASLWEFADKKLEELGVLCGLLPGSETTSQQLQFVVDLLTGMEQNRSDSQATVKLREALSSKQMFQKHYLEISELAMGTFKYIGRIRSARVIGNAMAKFYMLLNKPNKAEPFLIESVKTYYQEKWWVLADNTWLELAKCQALLSNTQRYLKSCMHIAASKVLQDNVRQEYCDKLLEVASKSAMRVKCEPAFAISNIILPEKGPFMLGQDVSVVLTIESLLPNSVIAKLITLIVTPESADANNDKIRGRHPSSSSINSVENAESTEIANVTQIDVQQHTVVSTEKKISSVSVVCNNAHAILRRAESGYGFIMERDIIKDHVDTCFSLQDVVLSPGKNEISLVTKAVNEGSFTSGQLCISLEGLDFIKSKVSKDVNFSVKSMNPTLELQYTGIKTKEYLIAGIHQEFEVVLNTQSFEVPAGSVLSISTPPGLEIKFTDSETNEISLDITESYKTIHLLADAFAQVTEMKQQFVDYQLTVVCSWCSQNFQPVITVQQPFQVTHKLHTAGLRKFIQVLVKGISSADFELSQPSLDTSKSPDIDVLSLNKPDKILHVNLEQTASYMWQIVNNTPETPDLTCWFSVRYSEAGTEESRECATSFLLQNYNTLYEVKCSTTPSTGKVCRVGSLCQLDIEVDSLDINCVHDQLMFEVILDSNSWAIASNEKRCGLVALTNGTGSISLNIMPLVTGYLRCPLIKLFKSSPKSAQDQGNDKKLQKSVDSCENFADGQIYNSSRAQNVEVLVAELNVSAM